VKAWEKIRIITDEAVPRLLTEDEQTWDFAGSMETMEDEHLKMLWYSHVPGSYAPESIMTAAVQTVENMGGLVENSEELIEKGLDALGRSDMIELHQISAELWHNINHPAKNDQSEYWKYKIYNTFEEFEKDVDFKTFAYTDTDDVFRSRLYSGWLAQIIGGAMGTAVEGYTTAAIKKEFGDITNYVREPNTYNDDITFELAFLKAFEVRGCGVTARDIALQWIGLIPLGWSAEEIALRNIRYGIFPPESGYVANPFREWIGAQMRGAICGMVAPGDAKEAARLAWMDGSVSHHNNGIFGEVFNAILVSLSFVKQDIREILDLAIQMIPDKSEYYSVISEAYRLAKTYDQWEDAWAKCELRYKEYNWIHAYPNAAAEVIALYYGNGDFNETMRIIALEGQDVDCNAAQIMTALGIILGYDEIPIHWKQPIGDQLDTYVRGMKKMSIESLADWTMQCARSK